MLSGTCQIEVKSTRQTFQCEWQIRTYTRTSEPEVGRALCLILHRTNEHASPPVDYVRVAGDDQSSRDKDQGLRHPFTFESFLAECLQTKDSESPVRIAFILPSISGYIIRSDFVRRRMVGSNVAKFVRGFLNPLQHVDPVGEDSAGLRQLLESAVAGLLLHDTKSEVDAFGSLLIELFDRLTFPWLSEKPIPRKRLVWVGGRYAVTESENIWDAAFALGISLIIVDEHGNWLEDDSGPYAYFREAFVQMDITADEGFVDRLFRTVQKLQKSMTIDGIMAMSDARLAKAAKVCEMLGLPTSPSIAYETSTNKAKVRMLEADTGGSRLFSDFEDFRRRFDEESLSESLEYPLVVKPCFGWASECVTKVTNEQELVEAAAKASGRHANRPLRQPSFLVERYAEGPEFDFNVVLKDKKIVFFQLDDDFPSAADRPGASSQANFMETQIMTPSSLPDSERSMIQESILRSILRLGYTSGIIHVEGRVVNSSMQYNFTEQGVSDLYPIENKQQPNKPPSVFLHEINARPPGYACSTSAQVAYGVDFYALQQLFSVGDMDRYASLAHQFRNGPQWHLAYVYFLPERPGVMKTLDTTKQLIDNNADVRDAIVANHTIVKGGQKVHGPNASELSFLGWILVASKVSRSECIRLARVIRKKFEYELE